MTKNNEQQDSRLKDATLGEYTQALKLSAQNNCLSDELLKKFLGFENFEDAFILNETLSDYEKHICLNVLDNVIENTGYKVIKTAHISDNSVSPMEYENIEIATKQEKKIYDEGYLFLEKNESKIVLNIYSIGSDYFKVKMYYNQQTEAENFFKTLKSYAKENNYLKNQKITPELTFLPIEAHYTWDSVILDNETKQRVQKNLDVILKNIDVYKANGIAFKRGIILKGEPGVGKTLIGKILCNVADCTVIWVTPKYLEKSANISRIGELARELSPTILFLEDIDLYGSAREGNFHKTLLGELMNQLDGIEENKNVIVVATTNRGDELEKALRNRPGRFDDVIEIKKPGVDEVEKMLLLYTGRVETNNLNCRTIAEKCENYTGAHVKDLVDLAIMTAIDENSFDKVTKKIVLQQEHLEKNIKTVGKKKIAISDAFKPRKDKSENHQMLDDFYED